MSLEPGGVEQSHLKTINSVLNKNTDPRLQTYGIALAQLPAEAIPNINSVLEVGMSGRLFRFRDIFSPTTKFFGMTTDQNHLQSAKNAGRAVEAEVEVVLRNLEKGIPTEWGKFGLAIDIFSASNYSSTTQTINLLSQALEPEGYIIVVPGDFFGGAADLLRERRDQTLFHQVFRYNQSAQQMQNLTVSVYPSPTTNEQFQIKARAVLAEQLQYYGYDVNAETPMKDLKRCLDDMCRIVGQSEITNFDGLMVTLYKSIEKAGLRNIKRFLTGDGTGMIAQAPSTK